MVRDDDRPWLASYPPDVPADIEVPAVPLTRLLDAAALDRPSYRRLRIDVDRFAGSLSGLGVGPMTRVAVTLPDCPQRVVAFFATLRLGAVVVQCNPLATAEELAEQLADTGATVVVCLDQLAETVVSVREQTRVHSVVVTSPRPRRRQPVAEVPADLTVFSYRSLVRAGTPARQASVDPATDVAVLRFSGHDVVMLSHTNLVASAHQIWLWNQAGTLLDVVLSDVFAAESFPAIFGQSPHLPPRPGSVGVPLPGTFARIVGETGELAVKGPQVFLGYWRREADVDPPMIDGWWLTGDLAVMDADGWFSITARK